MKRALSALILFAALLISSGAWAQQDPVQFTAEVNPATTRPGEYVMVTVNGTIQKEYHIYSVIPPEKPSVTPTEVKITLGNWKPVSGVSETNPETKYESAFKTNVSTHHDKVTFNQAFQVPKDATGTVTPSISIRYQACNAVSCLPPKTKTPTVGAITIEAGAARPEYSDPPRFQTPRVVGAPAAATPTTSTPKPASTNDGSLQGFLITAFGAGLLALITPCVFPLIPATLAMFIKLSKEDKTSPVSLAIGYSLSIIASFTVIGAVLAVTIGAAGANRVATNPWTNLVFALLFIVFGFALLELFELRLPSSIQNLSGKGRQIGGKLGVVVMGLTFVVSAFTCTAPFMGTVLVAASSASSGGDWVRPILGMTTFATALALPFFLLALFPSWLAKLPRSGAWLTTIKGTMGFLEMAAAIKFLSNADLVWQWHAITQPVMLTLWILISVLAGLWLIGVLHLGFNTPEGRPTIARGATAALFFAAAFYCLIGLTGRPLFGWMNAFLPPAEYRYGADTAKTMAEEDDFPYLDTLEKGIAAAKAQNKQIFVDFTGYTCLNCRNMEINVFPLPEVKKELGNFVMVKLYTDGGPDMDKNQEYENKTFKTVATPLYAILTPDGKPIDSIAYTPDGGKFAQFLRQTRERQNADARP